MTLQNLLFPMGVCLVLGASIFCVSCGLAGSDAPAVPALKGRWKYVAFNYNGKEMPIKKGKDLDSYFYHLTSNEASTHIPGTDVVDSSYTIRAGNEEGTFDLESRSSKRIEKYRFVREGNRVKMAHGYDHGDRPADLTPQKGVSVYEMELCDD